MESNELLASLAKMETCLNEVESARKQVESTVNASSELQKEVRKYVSAVKALCVNLQSWETDLRAQEGTLSHEFEEALSRVRSTCADVVRSFGTEVEKTSTNFNTKTESVIKRFTEQIGKLDTHVQDINALKDVIKKATSDIQTVKGSLSHISKDLKESQEGQDAVLEDIKQKISGLNATAQNAVSSISKEISNLTTLCQNIQSSVSSAKNDLNTTLGRLKDDITTMISETKAEVIKSAVVNRWIIIAGFIVIAILQYLFK